MARTSGAISNVSINFQTLVSKLGKDFQGEVVISKKWFDNVFSPTEHRVVKIDESESRELPAIESLPVAPPPARPVFEIED